MIVVYIVDGDVVLFVVLCLMFECKVGCILVNGFGMGVEVGYVMVYGGLFLVMFDMCMMFVGVCVIECFLWFVLY